MAEEKETQRDAEDSSAGLESGAAYNSDDAVEFPPEFNAEEIPPQKSGALRLFFALLLVVAVVGAGFYLLGQTLYTPPPAAPPVVTPRGAKMKVPQRPSPSDSAEGVKEEVVATETVAAVEEKPAQPAPRKLKPVAQPAPVAEAAFRLESPSYLYSAELKRVTRRIKQLGYKIERSSKPEPHEMTRLLVGLYTKPLAQKRLAAIQKKSAGAFLVAEQGKYAVYAGSYLSVDKARRQADLLYQNGVRSEEKRVRVDLPRTTLHFGRFATRLEARRVASQLAKKGIKDVRIVPFK